MDIGAGFLIGFREALEAALIVGVLITLLHHTNRKFMVKWVWGGVLFALIASVLTWQAFEIFVGEFEIPMRHALTSGEAALLFNNTISLCVSHISSLHITS